MVCFKDTARKSLQGRNLQNLTTRIVFVFFLYDCGDYGLSFWGEWQILYSLILFICVLFQQMLNFFVVAVDRSDKGQKELIFVRKTCI